MNYHHESERRLIAAAITADERTKSKNMKIPGKGANTSVGIEYETSMMSFSRVAKFFRGILDIEAVAEPCRPEPY